MATASAAVSPERSNAYKAILWGWLAAGVLDIAAASIQSTLRGGSPVRVLQVIASGLLGANSYQMGWRSAALGLAVHFLIAFVATVVFFVASRKIPFLTRQAVISGLLYGVVVYGFMNYVVLPLRFPNRATPPLSQTIIGLLIIMFFVGLPIALAVRHYSK